MLRPPGLLLFTLLLFFCCFPCCLHLTLLPRYVYILAAIPALLLTVLLFMDQQITSVIVNRKEHKLKVGALKPSCDGLCPERSGLPPGHADRGDHDGRVLAARLAVVRRRHRALPRPRGQPEEGQRVGGSRGCSSVPRRQGAGGSQDKNT